jgi:UDP-glucuronate 4-epimerase
MRKTILVTGAAGFIGSHVAQMLRERGDVVVGLDNLNDYYDPNRKRANLVEVESTPDVEGEFHFVEGDLRDKALLQKLFTEYSFDAIIHLAAMAGVRASVEDPQLYFDVNLGGTLGLLDAAHDYKIGNFVFASTSSVYGSTQIIPFQETDLCDRPLAPYAAAKRAAEMVGYTYHHLYQQNFTALRFFTVYGPRGRPDMMAYKVLDNIFSGRAVPLYNNGQMHRDWTFVGDIAEGVIAAADRPLGYEILNLGRGRPVLLAEFISVIEDVTGRKANLQPAPMMDTDMMTTYADSSKARELLGYEPKVSVREGVEQFWEWYRKAVLNRDHESHV